MMRATWASTSSRGGRPDNQDQHGQASAAGSRIFVVADGLGGHVAGALASETAVNAVLDSFRRQPDATAEALRAHFAAAQEAIRAAQRDDPEVTGCRTTAVVLIQDGRAALWGHVGDTRLYHLRDGRIVAQTLDHSVPQALVQAGELEPDEIRRHPDRNRLLRALGGEDDGAPTLLESPLPLLGGDAFLLCTDGFWEWVLEKDMEETRTEARDAGRWLERMEERLLERATGPYDNYTATSVFVEGSAGGSGSGVSWWLAAGLALAGALGFWLWMAWLR